MLYPMIYLGVLIPPLRCQVLGRVLETPTIATHFELRKPGMTFCEGPIAQLVEPSAHNRLVPGSSPGGPTTGIAKRSCL